MTKAEFFKKFDNISKNHYEKYFSEEAIRDLFKKNADNNHQISLEQVILNLSAQLIVTNQIFLKDVLEQVLEFDD